ncbi:MAG: hypothetical protein SFV52_04780 [Saprospiraceae bacterium]|nr:hypothetical protein [Saprospiraceae bacterium]
MPIRLFLRCTGFIWWLCANLIAVAGTAQTPPDALRLSEGNSAYFRHINLAARAIYRNEFAVAAAQYDSAFRHRTHPFFVDLQNALLVNSKTGRHRQNDLLLEKLMLDKRLHSAALYRFMPIELLDEQNRGRVARLEPAALEKNAKPHPWADALREMYETSQFVLRSDAYTNNYVRTKDSLDNLHIIRFVQLCRQYGFPTEEMTGIVYDDEKDWQFVLPHLLQEFLSGRNRQHRKTLLPLLDSALHDGALHPSVYASLMDYANANRDHYLPPNPAFNYLNTTINTIRGRVYRPFVYYSDSLMQEVNANRSAIGLDSFHVVQRQVVCQTFFPQKHQGQRIIHMYPFARIDEMPGGFVQYAFEREGLALDSYEIGVGRILSECGCEQKVY